MPFEMNRRALILGAGASATLYGLPAAANPHCEAFAKTVIWDVEHALWTSTGPTPSGKVIYVVGAPWCPYCKRVYLTFMENPLDVELRFVPMDVPQQKDQRRLVDIIVNQDGSGLDRTYRTGKAPRIDVDDATYKMVLDAARGAAFGLRERLRPSFGTWGSPVFLFLAKEGGFIGLHGYHDVAELAADARPASAEAKAVYPQIAPFLIERPIDIKVVRTGERGSLMLTLPRWDMATINCLAGNFALNAVAEVTVDDTHWYKVHGLVIEGELNFGYVEQKTVYG